MNSLIEHIIDDINELYKEIEEYYPLNGEEYTIENAFNEGKQDGYLDVVCILKQYKEQEED